MGNSSVKLIAAARQMYDGRWLFPRDVFFTTEEEAADLCALNFATRAPVEAIVAEKIQSPEVGAMKFTVVDGPKPESKRRRRSKKRRSRS